jgi:hypothetical protein
MTDAQAQQGHAQQAQLAQQTQQQLPPTASGQPPPVFVTPADQPSLTSPLELARLQVLLQGLLQQPDQSMVSTVLEKLANEVGGVGQKQGYQCIVFLLA